MNEAEIMTSQERLTIIRKIIRSKVSQTKMLAAIVMAVEGVKS